MKVSVLIPILLVAVCTTLGHARELTSLCPIKCPSGFTQLTYPKTEGACPLCYMPPYDCGPKYKDGLCCGGYTGVACPAIACSSTQTVAISGTGGCAQAYAVASTQSLSQVKSSLKAVFKSVMDNACDHVKTTYYDTADATVVYEQLKSIPQTAVAAAAVWSKAIASVVYKYWAYTCTCRTCYSNCNSYVQPSYAKAMVQGQVAAVATACASALAEAVAEVSASSCISAEASTAQTDAYAYSLASALAQDVQTALLDFDKTITSKDMTNCKYAIQDGKCETAIAKATACTVARVLAWIYGTQTTYNKYIDGVTTITSDANVYTAIDSCSASVSLSGKDVDYPENYYTYSQVCLVKYCKFA